MMPLTITESSGRRVTALLMILVVSIVCAQDCKQDGPLGMISGEIRDWQITASSTFPARWSKGCEERHARLYGKDGQSWCSQYKGRTEWLQIDLGVEATITGIMTQGRGDNRDWVTAYAVSYSQDAIKWSNMVDEFGKQRIFDANVDSYSVKHNYLETPLVTRFIRLHPLSYHRHPSMRVELIGCQPCKKILSQPPHARLTASSARGRRAMRTCDASYGHTMTGKGWCARKLNDAQWLQVDLGPPARVTGLVTKGRGDGKKDAWVTSYRVAYGTDGKSWALYKDADHLSPKIFGGNHNRDGERVHYLNRPIPSARYVRFHPVTWHGAIAMRVGVIGCPHDGEACDRQVSGAGKGAAAAFFQFSNSTRCLANLAYDKPAWLDRGSGGGGGGRHRRRQAGGGSSGWDGWIDEAGGNSCVDLGGGGGGSAGGGKSGGAVRWLIDLKLRQPVQGVLLSANRTFGNKLGVTLDRVEVFVAKRSRQIFSSSMGTGRGQLAQQMRCGSVHNLNLTSPVSGTDAAQSRSVHISCAKALQGRFVYIEAQERHHQLGGGGSTASAAASLCNLRVY